jgi:hypothetical protein
VGKLPLIGLLASSEPYEDLSSIRALGLDHVAVQIDTDNHHWRDDLAQQMDVADAIGAPVQLYLRGPMPDHLPEELNPIEVVLNDVGEAEWSADRVDQVRERFPGIPVIAASRENFTELNRDPVPLTGLSGHGFGVNPQVHAFDNRSIVEATESLATLVRDTRRLGLDWVSVGPLTFEPRQWSSRTPDVRLTSPFYAAWILASLRNLAAGGANRVTLGFTHGERGLTQNLDAMALLQTVLAPNGEIATILPTSTPLERQSLQVGDQEITADFLAETVTYATR